MIRKFSMFTFLIAICSVCFAQTNMHPVSILNGKVMFQLSETLPAFQKDALRLLWKTQYPITEISLNNSGETFLEYAYTDKSIDDNNISAFTDEILTTFSEKKKYTKIDDDGIYLEDGKNIGYLKVISKEKGDHTFHYFFYLSVNDRLLLFHFATPARQQKAWETSMEATARSIKITG